MLLYGLIRPTKYLKSFISERLIFFETWVMKITLLICFLLQFVVAMTDFSKLIELKDKDPKTASGSKKQRTVLHHIYSMSHEPYDIEPLKMWFGYLYEMLISFKK